MKKIIIPLILAFSATICRAQANPEFARLIRENHAVACLNACPYELNPMFGDLQDSPAPKGYKPVYISHYGRHGSRSSWEQHYYAEIIKNLTGAKNAGILTASGDSLLRETILVNEATAGMDGRLTPRGCREHRGIAERMYRRYPAVFRKGSRNVRVLSSEVPRCLVSMAAFTGRLSEIDNKLKISMDCGSQIQKIISNGTSPFASDAKGEVRDSLVKAMRLDVQPLMELLFTDVDAARKYVPDANRLCKQIFATARISRSFDYDFDMFRYLSFDAIYKWAEVNNLNLYLGQCNSKLLGHDRMPRTKPLVDNIVNSADEALASGETAADLRFGHDYPLLALCSYFGIEGVGERYSVREALENWISTYYTPFAGNLQLVFYKGRRDGEPVLVKFLLNEKETLIPALRSVQGPYYRWDDVKAYLKTVA